MSAALHRLGYVATTSIPDQDTKIYISIACYTIHNNIRLMIVEDTHNLSTNLKRDIIELDVSRYHLMTRVRDDITNQIWTTFEG